MRRSDTYCDAAHTIAARLRRILLGLLTDTTPSAARGELNCQVRDIEFDHGDRYSLVKVAGDLDNATSHQLFDEVMEPIATGAHRVLVDLAGLRSVDHSGLATLARVAHAAERHAPGATLTLTAVPEPIRLTIDASGYREILRVA